MDNTFKSFEEQQKEKILKSYNGTEDLIKGGEGSRGGKVIGHTRSGKPVYESHTSSHSDYRDFDEADHSWAAHFHEERAKLHRSTTAGGDGNSEKYNHHSNIAIEHRKLQKEVHKKNGGGGMVDDDSERTPSRSVYHRDDI